MNLPFSVMLFFLLFFGYFSLDCFFANFLAAVSIEICLVDVFFGSMNEY